ncbi:hypothetical protein GFS31_35260 [Leptolyngbya sp. BL0902]|nr:hypothetical protein GFS31_35260 [Leptolyngbya sp. BL0902]
MTGRDGSAPTVLGETSDTPRKFGLEVSYLGSFWRILVITFLR